MGEIAVKIENLSKQYRLGVISTGTLSHDLNRWWYKVRGKEDPFLKIGEINDRSEKGKSDLVWALKDINLEVRKGEVLGSIGRNGAGKSTLLKILSQVTGPSTGSIKVKGRIGSLLEVGTGFHPELTGRENIFLNGAILGMTKAEIRNKLDEIVDFSGTTRYIDTPVKRYSSGMKVRLAFAVAAHLEPEVLVVDEVLAVGDAEFQNKAIGKMQEVSKEGGRTVLFVSHNMASIENLCQRCLLLKDGQIDQIGETSEIIQRYLTSGVSHGQNLKDRVDRKGAGQIKFIDYWFEDKGGQTYNNLKSGADYIMCLKFHKESDCPFEGIHLAIGIDGRSGARILHLDNQTTGENAVHSVENNTLISKIFIPKLPLKEGRYTFTLFLEQFGLIQDWIKEAGLFNVASGDFYKTGKVLPNNQGEILIQYSFDIKQNK